MDKPKAVTAAAHKLARLIYTMLTKGEEYTDQGQDYYEERLPPTAAAPPLSPRRKNAHETHPQSTTGLRPPLQLNHLGGVS